MLGPVFRTHDPDADRLVAVKAFALDLIPEQAAELASECQRLVDAGLKHQHLALPLGAGVEDFVAYLASQYVAGESLDAAIRQYGPAPFGDAARLITHVAEALDAAARVGIVHGALHPRDILVTPGETHVTGFGVAMSLERIGLHGPIRRPYVAPERENGESWGSAADVFSLAAIACEVLTGRRAMPGTDQPFPGLADLRAHNLDALRETIESALDPDPGRRHAHAADFAAAFAAALGDGTEAPVSGGRLSGQRSRKPRSRAPKLPGLDEPLAAAEAPLPELRDEPVEEALGKPAAEPVASPRVRIRRRDAVFPPPTSLAVPPPDDAAADPAAASKPEAPASPKAEARVALDAPPPAPPNAEPTAPPVPEPSSAADLDSPAAVEAELAAAGVVEQVVESEIVGSAFPADDVGSVPAADAVVDTEPEIVLESDLAALDNGRTGAVVHPAVGGEPEPGAVLETSAEALIDAGTGAVLELEAVLDPEFDSVSQPREEGAANLEAELADPGVAERRAEPRPELPLDSPDELPATLFDELPDWPPDEHAAVAFDEAAGGLALDEPVEASACDPLEALAAAAEPLLPDSAGDDLSGLDAIAFTPEARELAATGFTPDLQGLADELAKPEPPRRLRRERRRIPLDDLRDPEMLASEPPVPRAFDPLSSPESSRQSPEFAPGPSRPAVSAWTGRMPVAAGVAAGLILGLLIGFILWAGSGEPESILPPGTVTEVLPPPAAQGSGTAPSAGGSAAAPTPAFAVAVPETRTPAPSAPPPAPAKDAATTPAASAKAEVGAISVRSTPTRADVFVNGEPRGWTPRNLRDLPYGTYTIRVAKQGYAPQERAVTIGKARQQRTVSFTLVRGAVPRAPAANPRGSAARPAAAPVSSLSIETRPPGGRVRMDGQDVGVTPITLSPVTAGSHKIEILLPGYRVWSTTVTVAEGQRQRLTASLERDTPR